MVINVNGIGLFSFELWRIFNMEQIFENLKDVSLATTVISLVVIFLVGCFKLIPGIKNLNENVRKAIYQVLNIVLGGVLSVLYTLFISKGGWDMNMLRFAIIVVIEINALYPLYENLGLRELWKKIISLVTKKKETPLPEAASSQAPVEQVEEKKDTFSDGEWLE